MTPEEFDWTIGVNLKHVFFAAQAVVPQMQARGGGSIINMSSVAWMRGAPALPVYAAAKAAIVGFTNSLARLVGPDRIRVNAIAPGMVITERQRRLWYPDEQKIAELRTRQAIPDAVTPDDIASMALFLASDESQRITRQCFHGRRRHRIGGRLSCATPCMANTVGSQARRPHALGRHRGEFWF